MTRSSTWGPPAPSGVPAEPVEGVEPTSNRVQIFG